MEPHALTWMPTWNASLNALSGVFLVLGFLSIRRKKIGTHRRFMLAACSTSVVFLVSYLFYHFFAGSTRFIGTGWSRPVYFGILLSHTVLAVVIVPMVIASVRHGLKNQIVQHRRVARWTFPLWSYVSVTGVLVYFFLYHWFPSG